ncbi:MAG: RidA family protein [Clostridiales bacterium]|nr:RidA family protein [Clostridiales bacterium]
MSKEFINSKNAPAAVGPYVHARKAGNMYFISGQLGIDPSTRKLVEGVRAQTHQSLKNLGEVLKEAGLDYTDVVKTTVFLDNIDDFAIVNEIYAEYFTGVAPARSCVEVAKIPAGGLVEVEAIAVRDN